jgi:hypothetical protein
MKKSRTIKFAALLAALGAVQASLELFNAILTPQVYGLITMGIGVAVAVLRVVTTTGLNDK